MFVCLCVSAGAGDADTAEPAVFDEAQLPWIVIIAVSSVGALLLIINVTLVIFFVRRRMRRSKQPKKMVESACKFSSVKKCLTLFIGTYKSFENVRRAKMLGKIDN